MSCLLHRVSWTEISLRGLGSLCHLKSQQIFFFSLSDNWSCKPFLVPFPCTFLINTAWHLVLIFASVCRQVATFNGRSRKIKQHLLTTNSARKSRSAFRNTVQHSLQSMTSRFATEIICLHHSGFMQKCLFSSYKMLASVQNRELYLP